MRPRLRRRTKKTRTAYDATPRLRAAHVPRARVHTQVPPADGDHDDDEEKAAQPAPLAETVMSASRKRKIDEVRARAS